VFFLRSPQTMLLSLIHFHVPAQLSIVP
jgi:hypothetical protein